MTFTKQLTWVAREQMLPWPAVSAQMFQKNVTPDDGYGTFHVGGTWRNVAWA